MAQATVDLGLNTAAFTAGLGEAERKAQSFEGRIAGFFKRDPTQRAERAFSDLAVNLSTGNVAQGIAGFAAKLTGLGLAAGIGVGAAVALFQRFKGQIDETSKSTEALFGQLSRPLATQAALGIEGIQAQIGILDKSITDISEKRRTLGSRIGEAFERLRIKPVPADIRGAPETFEIETVRQTRSQEAIESGLKRIHALRLADVEAAKALVNVHALAVQFSEKEAALEKNRIDAEQKRAALRLKFGGDPREAANLHAELVNISRDEKLSADEIERKAALKDRELEIDKDIAAQALRGVSTEEQKISRLQQELALIQDQLKGAESLTAENRKQLETSQAKTLAELAAARAAASGRPLLSQQDIHERAKLTLQDIAAATPTEIITGDKLFQHQQLEREKRFAQSDLDLARIEAEQAKLFGPGATARQAQRDEELARQAALRGQLPLAESFFGLSDQLRSSIPGLKSAEQPVSMADALKEYGKGPEIVQELQELKAKMDTYWGQ